MEEPGRENQVNTDRIVWRRVVVVSRLRVLPVPGHEKATKIDGRKVTSETKLSKLKVNGGLYKLLSYINHITVQFV